ncbi:Uncharacterized protein AC509_5530 [Pseudomonas amygdali pv. morsprunorum]|uniref:DUF6957 family protein n=2 Tax=Pseudomonas amygdali TaxID=47877 RepID=UPI0006B9598B|nr:hypothetical protein [Pseudomonas amygdali]KPC46634.1 Uncharacterized protein AC509_5530 [Pseudomonas amygdali pv. morsprunorum]
MQDHQVSRMFGPGEIMFGSSLALEEAIALARDQFPHQSICVVGNWFWIDLQAPTQVIEQMAAQGQRPVMLLAFDVLFSSSGASRTGEWLRSTPLVAFTDDMFFRTQHALYVLMGPGRTNTIPLSTVLRLFSSERDGY